NVAFNDDRLCLDVSSPLRRFQRMASGDDVHVRPDHDAIADVDAAHVVKRAALVDGHTLPNPKIETVSRIEGRDEDERVVHLPARQLAEYFSHLGGIVE